MELLGKIAVFCLIAVLVKTLLQKDNPAGALLTVLALCLVAAGYLVRQISPVVELLRQILGQAQLSGEIFLPLLKTVVMAVVVKIGAALCRDGGSSAAAAVIEIAGTFCALITALPLLRQVMTLLQQLG